MLGRKWIIGGLSVLMLSLATAIALADRLTLKDGTVLEGKVIKQSDQYWIKTADGESRIVPATEVASYTKTPAPGAAPEPAAPKPDVPAPTKPTPKSTPATPEKPVETPTPVAPAAPPQVTVSVPATSVPAHPVATGVKLTQGQQFIITPNATDTWGKTTGNHQGKKCDYKGFADRPGWMALACKVGNTGVVMTAGTPTEAPEAGELFLYCSDTDADKNDGSIRVTIIGPLPPSFVSVQRRVDAAETASAVVGIWQDFLASHPADPDLSQAKAELAKWTDMMAKGGGEKIDGKWVTGADHKALMDKFDAVMKEAEAHLRKNETLQGVKKLEEAQQIYPNSFDVNFYLGYIAFTSNDADKAMPLFERALKLQPKSSESLANIGVIHFEKNDYERGVLEVQQAAEMTDSPEIAFDLNVMVNTVPEPIKSSDKLKGAIADAKLLASRYSLPGAEFMVHMKLLPVRMREGGEEGAPPPGAQASGTGFVINSDGLILTNRHVAKNGKTYEITLQSGEKMPAEAVVIDDEQDLALLRVKPAKPLPTVKFADHDTPGDGAECTVIGFPLGDRYTSAAKITHGIVTTGHANTEGADVMIDAKVNPGNSGGPILDQSGNVMAIVCMKTLSTHTEDTYGLGISAGKIRKFLDKNKIKVEKAGLKNKTLTTEEIAAKAEPMTVFIVTTF